MKYTFRGKASGLKLSHIPSNNGVISVCIEGVEFEVKSLNGMSTRKRSFMARKSPALNFAVWDWHVSDMPGLRSQLGIAADRQNITLLAINNRK
ncbi:hypothetical protein [Pseudomonas phage vB_PseuGesM_254]|uniref:Uncharacterized protein n=1 Tax=Pseudomonas phage vB_PseuGesM_254 TaxID=3092638 RepID=A0AAX4G6T7_9CAUD|nr:hypothetical protein [Pseudomonas phage PseuGes_254]